MEVRNLSIKNFTSTQKKGYASIIDDPAQLSIIHSHDYYELFLVYKGYAKHNINGKITKLETGCISFVRPEDVHFYFDFSKDFQIINIMISQDIMESLFHYLGEGFEPSRLLKPETCPTVWISTNEFSSLVDELEHLVIYKEILKERSDAMYKITIMNIITRYFPLPIIKPRTDVPQWLRLLSLEMLKKENFVDGLSAMYRLSGKSIEHLSRSYRKYLNKSPTQFINEIRVKHSARLIMLTDNSITNICYDVGFNNLSNYYHLFKRIYGVSPKKFKKNSFDTEIDIDLISKDIIDSDLPHGVSPFD